MIRLSTSPTPMGLTSGHLSRDINRQARRALRLVGLVMVEHIFFATTLMAAHRSTENLPKEQQACFHATKSILDGPAAPLTFNAINLMTLPFFLH